MPHYGAISRRNLIKGLRDLGFEGPETGTGDHPEFMVKGSLQLKLPNPHRGDIGVNLLERILKQAGISRREWESV
jgi:predicted RNA binding protein YcfA (HicA-like mRNA interferase family)